MQNVQPAENFLRFQVQDKHNASSFFVCLGKSCLNPMAKVVFFNDNQSFQIEYFAFR